MLRASKSISRDTHKEAPGEVVPTLELVNAFDRVLAAASIIVFIPLLLITSIAIKLDTRGPILVRETRYGYKNRAIQVFKFRLTEDDCGSRRLTRVGQILSETGIEDLPQLVNILRGEMSISSLLHDSIFRP